MNGLVWRKVKNAVATAACALAALVTLAPLVSLVWLVVSRGIGGLSASFFVSLPAPVGEPGGGVGNAVVGSLLVVALACAIGLPLGIGAGVFLAERGNGTVGRSIRFVAEVLSGVPSIVMGVAAYGLIVVPMKRFSALAAAVALALLMLPTVARSSEELIRLVPDPLREAALALGVRRWRTSFSVVLRTAAAGLATTCLLAIARIAGETAPVLFTALNNQHWNVRPDQPTATLPVQIFNYAISPYADWHAKAWSAALLLLLLVASLSLVSRLLSRRGPRGAHA